MRDCFFFTFCTCLIVIMGLAFLYLVFFGEPL